MLRPQREGACRRWFTRGYTQMLRVSFVGFNSGCVRIFVRLAIFEKVVRFIANCGGFAGRVRMKIKIGS